ncbi:MAG: Ig-like domain-containing protein [Leptospira sp.]|nr:Ig-like domain-containing protein [Leptospira sp.]
MHRILNIYIFSLLIICHFFLTNCKNDKLDAEKFLTFLGDDDAPKITSAIPSMGDKGLKRNQKITILFDRPMNINSCVQSFSISPATQGFYDLNEYSLDFTPSTQWNYGTYTYTLTKNCESKEGRDLKELYSASFTIGDTNVAGSFPEILTVTVGTGSISDCNHHTFERKNILRENLINVCMGTPNSNKLNFHFSRPMDKTSVSGGLVFSPNFSATYSWENETNLIVQPDSAFAHNSRINFTISSNVTDVLGVKFQNPTSGSFLVGTGNLVPSLESIHLARGTLSECLEGNGISENIINTSIENVCLGNSSVNPMIFTFSKKMNQTQTQSQISISPSIIGNGIWTEDGKVYTFTPDTKLSYGQRYVVTVGGSASSIEGIPMGSVMTYSFIAGGAISEAPTIQAIGVQSQGCSNNFPGTGSNTGGDWLSPNCFWDSSLSVLSPASYRFRSGDTGGGTIATNTDCADVNTDNFRIIFSNYMDLNSVVNAIRLRRLSPPSTVIQLASWSWNDCQTVYPFGCRVIDLIFAELEASCKGSSSFGDANTLGDFNLLRSNNAPNGYPYYLITVDSSAKDVNQRSISNHFNFSMEAK